MTFLHQEVPQREKDHTEAAPATVPAKVLRSADQDRPVSQEEVPRQVREGRKGSRQRGLHLRGAVLYRDLCRKKWGAAASWERLWKE